MILGDRNISILVSKENIVVHRGCSVIKYDQSFRKEYSLTILHLPRSFGEKIYDYSNNKITSLQTQEQRNFSIGPVTDYLKHEKEFFFIKNSKDIVNKKGTKILTYKSIYCFSGSYIYWNDGTKLYKTHIQSLETSLALQLDRKPIVLCVKKDLIIYADPSNRIHIHSKDSYKVYHWMSNKVVKLLINEEYVIAVSKTGVIAQFHIKLHKIEPLLDFKGDFLDIKIKDDKFLLLTSFEFIVFDFLSNSTCLTDYLVPDANFQVSEVKKSPDLEDSDVFKIKRKTKIENFNLIENKGICSEKITSYAYKDFAFLFDPSTQEIVSVFKMDSLLSFVSGPHMFSVSQRRSNYTIKMFDVYLDRIILVKSFNICSKANINFKNICR